MSKKTIIIAVVCLILVLGIGGVILFSNQSTTTAPLETTEDTFSPFGDPTSVVNTNPTTETSISHVYGTTTTTKQPVLVKVVDGATAGATFVQNGTAPMINFVDRTTGNTYSFNPESRILARLTNTTIPNISRSLWTKNGANVIMQFIDKDESVNTYAGKIISKKTATSSKISTLELQGQFLPKGVEALTLSPSNTKAFYIVPSVTGSEGFIANPDGTKPTKLLSMPLTEVVTYWPIESTIIIATKPAASVPGYVYSINSKTGAFTRLIAGINGLTILPDPTGTKIAYTDETSTLKIMTIKDGSVITSSVRTIADKCIWSTKEKGTLFCAIPNNIPNGTFPDTWYQGLVSFTDTVSKINTATNIATVLTRPFETFKQPIDATDLSLSANEDYLLFTNKRDYTLWSLNLSN